MSTSVACRRCCRVLRFPEDEPSALLRVDDAVPSSTVPCVLDQKGGGSTPSERAGWIWLPSWSEWSEDLAGSGPSLDLAEVMLDGPGADQELAAVVAISRRTRDGMGRRRSVMMLASNVQRPANAVPEAASRTWWSS